MEDNPVRIHPYFSPDPAKQLNYTVICHSHRICTVVTADPSVVRKWVYRTRRYNSHLLSLGSLVVGLGVQSSPGRSSPAATLQLCVRNHCLIFQLLHAARSPHALHSFLSDPDIILVGFRNHKDADLLESSHHHLHVSRLFDVCHVASDVRGCRRRAPMEALAEEVLEMDGLKKEEAVGRSAWDEWSLSEEQVQYACIDALFSLLMAKTLRVWEWVEDR